MAERELRITSFVRGDYVMAVCEQCKTAFRVGMADDLKAAKASDRWSCAICATCELRLQKNVAISSDKVDPAVVIEIRDSNVHTPGGVTHGIHWRLERTISVA
jgi:hypothetical protein